MRAGRIGRGRARAQNNSFPLECFPLEDLNDFRVWWVFDCTRPQIYEVIVSLGDLNNDQKKDVLEDWYNIKY